MNNDNNLNNCPVTGKESKLIKSFSKDFILKELSEYFGVEVDSSIVDSDYKIFKNMETGFEFSSPMLAGSDKFYSWILNQEKYYPSARWEWLIVKNLIMNSKTDKEFNILDVGCGSGEFLETLKDIKQCNSAGLDTSEVSMKICQEKGLETHCCMLGDYHKKNFDFVVSFHCLEHVSEPLLFVKEMLEHTKHDGEVFISTPYSPMSFEYGFYDSLNYPPHHLTRWNSKSYEALAQALGCNIEFYYPKLNRLITRIYENLKLKWLGVNNKNVKIKFFIKLLFHPVDFIKSFIQQLTREKVNGKTVPNVVLVKLSRK